MSNGIKGQSAHFVESRLVWKPADKNGPHATLEPAAKKILTQVPRAVFFSRNARVCYTGWLDVKQIVTKR